jgi:coproporphyrinogen III oxidase-like Fe-S oxidoreductase
MFEHLMLGLRLRKGVEIATYNQLYNCDLENLLQPVLVKNKTTNLIFCKDGMLKCSNNGIMILQSLLIEIWRILEVAVI